MSRINVFSRKTFLSKLAVDIGKRIESIRKKADISQNAFVKEVDAGGRGTVNNWEKGRRLPRLEQIIKIAEFANVSLDWIIRGKDIADVYKELQQKQKEIDKLKEDYNFISEQLNSITNKVAENIENYNKQRRSK